MSEACISIRLIFITAVGMLLGGSCTRGGHQTVPSKDVGAAISLSALYEEAVAAYCDSLVRCGDSARSQFGRGLMPGVSECRDVLLEHVPTVPEIAWAREQVAAGKLDYDGREAATCLSAARDACAFGGAFGPEDFSTLSGCQSVFEGNVAVGEPCHGHEACGPDAYCAGKACPGVCRRRRSLGSPCEKSQQCSLAQVDGVGVQCRDGRCLNVVTSAAREAGQRCAPSTDEKVWKHLVPQCAGELLCAADGEGKKRCFEPRAPGAVCEMRKVPCQDGYTCVPAPRSTDGTCRRLIWQKEEGTRCDIPRARPGPVQMCSALHGLECKGSVCVRVERSKKLGSPCRKYMRGDCEAGLWCDGKQCQPEKPAGAPCEDGRECQSHTCSEARGHFRKICQAERCAI